MKSITVGHTVDVSEINYDIVYDEVIADEMSLTQVFQKYSTRFRMKKLYLLDDPNISDDPEFLKSVILEKMIYSPVIDPKSFADRLAPMVGVKNIILADDGTRDISGNFLPNVAYAKYKICESIEEFYISHHNIIIDMQVNVGMPSIKIMARWINSITFRNWDKDNIKFMSAIFEAAIAHNNGIPFTIKLE